MGLIRDDSGSERVEAEQRAEQREKEKQARQAALQQATKAVKANPQFLSQLQEDDLDTQEFPEVSDNIGPIASGANIIGNREERYERELKWINMNRSERTIAEAEPGRLCRGSTREIANGKHGEGGGELRRQTTMEQRRALRDAYEVLTNRNALAVQNRGLRAITEATAVSRTEGVEDDGLASKASKLFDG